MVDDDIIMVDTWETIFTFDGESFNDNLSTLTTPFNPSNSFKITGSIMWKTYSAQLQKAVYCYEKDSWANGMEITYNRDTDNLLFGVRKVDNSMYWVTEPVDDFLFNVYYDFDIYYDTSLQMLNIKVIRNSEEIINDSIAISCINNDYPRMCLTGDPQWVNGSCRCEFKNFKIEIKQ